MPRGNRGRDPAGRHRVGARPNAGHAAYVCFVPQLRGPGRWTLLRGATTTYRRVMDVEKLMSTITGDLTPKRVFGEPIERDGVVLVPVASVRGGAGAGSGGREGEEGTGGGGGVAAKGLGVFVVKEGNVSWQPAVDVAKLAIAGQVFALAFMLVLRSILRRR